MPNATTIQVLDAATATQTVSTIDNTIGPAGTASTNVQTVQGIAGMTPVLATLSGTNNIATVSAVTAISNALPAGSNAIGKLAANDGVDVGDVTINNGAGAAAVNIQDGGNSVTVDYATTGSGTATGAIRVELPSNGTGVIATVGAVTAITNALPAGTNAIGKLATNSGVTIGAVEIAAAQSLAATQSGTWTVQPGNTANTTAWKVDGSAVTQPVSGYFVSATTQFTRPNDTTAYTAGDAMSDSTSAPTSGGFTLTGAGRASGGSGIITDAVMGMSTAAATSLQGEIWLFDQAVTAINDNAAFALSDGDRDNLVAIIPFTTSSGATNNASAWVSGLNIGFTCVGTANLRYLVKVINAYTPAAQEVLTVRIKVLQVT